MIHEIPKVAYQMNNRTVNRSANYHLKKRITNRVKCEMCNREKDKGHKDTFNRPLQIHMHEVWGFLPTDKPNHYLKYLHDFQILCMDCHDLQHIVHQVEGKKQYSQHSISTRAKDLYKLFTHYKTYINSNITFDEFKTYFEQLRGVYYNNITFEEHPEEDINRIGLLIQNKYMKNV